MKKHLLTLLVLVLAALLLVSCGRGDGLSLDGKLVATFDVNGGTLDYKTSNTHTKINYAYEPGSFLLDPSEIAGYSLYRDGYNFTGWYTSKDCLPSERWDFETRTIDQGNILLYAGWEKAIKHTYTICYPDGENVVTLNAYDVKEGDTFSDWRGFADKRQGYTAVAFYSDASLTTPWDTSFTHPGGETDNDVRVYVKYIEGTWELVSSFAQLNTALKNNKNVYLTTDIDCEGKELSYTTTYNKILEGNGYTVSNFTVTASTKQLYTRRCAIFTALGAKAEIRNVNFADARYVLETTDLVNSIQLALIALSTTAPDEKKEDEVGAKITNVTVSATLYTNYENELPRMSEAIADDASFCTLEGFTVTVEKQPLGASNE